MFQNTGQDFVFVLPEDYQTVAYPEYRASEYVHQKIQFEEMREHQPDRV